MKNRHLTLSFIFLGIVFFSLTVCVLYSKAQAVEDLNPYDNPDLSLDDMISLYHNNMNTAFNGYFSALVTSIPTDPTQAPPSPYPGDPGTPGSAFKTDGTPLTVSDCFADPTNYSTFCVAANLLGANSDDCAAYSAGKLLSPSDGLDAFCRLGTGGVPLNGYLNFIAALKKRSTAVFDTQAEKDSYDLGDPIKGAVNSTAQPAKVTFNTLTGKINDRKKEIDQQVAFAKQALDQTLSAYDQLTFAWPIHLKYVQIYADLETYRDNLVSIRHQTDIFPKKFVDLTSTACL